MKSFVIVLGVILLVLGVIGLVHPNFNYHQQEEVAKLGPIKATVDEEKTAQIPPAVSITPGSRHRACCSRAAHEAVVSATNSLDWYQIKYLPSRSTVTATICGTTEAIREHTSAVHLTRTREPRGTANIAGVI
jgi:hypothetical protein